VGTHALAVSFTCVSQVKLRKIRFGEQIVESMDGCPVGS